MQYELMKQQTALKDLDQLKADVQMRTLTERRLQSIIDTQKQQLVNSQQNSQSQYEQMCSTVEQLQAENALLRDSNAELADSVE